MALGSTAFNRNEYHEFYWGIKSCLPARKAVNITATVSRFSRGNVGVLMSHNPMGFHGLLQGQL
jgi:hypothetical protein